MAVRRKVFYDEVMVLTLTCSLRVVVLDGDFWTFPAPRANRHGLIWRGRGRASAMRVPTEGKLTPSELGPNKEAGSPGNDEQRYKLLPIHGYNVLDLQ
jgi:hypothetical protein